MGIMSRLQISSSPLNPPSVRTKHAPNKVCWFAFKLEAELSPHPAVGSITAHHVLCPYNLRAALFILALSDQIICIVFCQIAPEQPIIYRRTLALGRLCFFFGEVAQLNSNGVVIGRVVVAVIGDLKRFWQYSTFHAKRIFGVLFDMI
jgi:hypothetical protein